MKLKILTLPLPWGANAFDDDALADAIAGHEVASVASHVVHTPDAPRLVLVLGLNPARRPAADPAHELGDDDRLLFDRLRVWRNTIAHARGVAPYLVLSNRALAAVASAHPREIAALPTLPGIGAAKAAAYGPALLQELTRLAVELRQGVGTPA